MAFDTVSTEIKNWVKFFYNMYFIYLKAFYNLKFKRLTLRFVRPVFRGSDSPGPQKSEDLVFRRIQ